MKLTGAQALIKSLEEVGVEVIFGLPGGAILPVYDPILESHIRHILVRHEQGAGHAAEGYAYATGRPGVAMVTSGPGATNIVTPVADAYMDSVPMVVITGQVGTPVIGTDAFQEADVTGITMPITKHNYLLTDPEEIPEAVAEAFHIASTGRPGPVLIDLPKDVSQAETKWYWPDALDLPGYNPTTKGHSRQIKAAAKLILESKKPVIYAGGGVIKGRAADELRSFAELTGAPVVTTLMARGAIPDDHELCLGMPGMHGNYTAITAMQRSDLLITLGARFDDRVTGRVDGFAPEAKIIHADIDPAELSKIRRADVPIVGDLTNVISALSRAVQSEREKKPSPDLGPWWAQLREWQKKYPLAYEGPNGDGLKPQFVVEKLHEVTGGDAILVSGVGQHQMWASQFWRFNSPYSWINSGGLGTMGFAIPAAIGAKVGRPDETVWAIDGDGCFQMTGQELITASISRIPVKIAILNNAYLGMVRQWQELFYDERYSEVALGKDIPDYVGWAESMGCAAFRVDDVDDVIPTIEKAQAIDDQPVVVDFRTDWTEHVYPMIPAGASNDEVILSKAEDPDATEDHVPAEGDTR
ncbi:MAG: acetolactate synthase large subunit [Acidobacteria bacterium]|nr:MAG: acetolactate synthase large subunit [Acidobacteriota bacterium]